MQKLGVVAAYGLAQKMAGPMHDDVDKCPKEWPCRTEYSCEGHVHKAVACAFMLLRHGLEGLPEDSTVAIMREVHTAACHMLNVIVVCMCSAEGRAFKRDMVLTPSEHTCYRPVYAGCGDISSEGLEHV